MVTLPPKLLRLVSACLGLGLGMLPAGADELTVTTFYPKPRAAYAELRVENNTLLAKNGGNVAVGRRGQPGRVPLDIEGYFTLGGTLSIAQDAFGGSPAWGVSNDTGRFVLLMQSGVGPAGTTVLTVTRSDKMGVGNLPSGTPPKNTLDVKGRMLVGQAYAGQEEAEANGLAVEDRLSVGREATDNPQEELEVAGAVVIGSGLAGTETAPANGLLIEERLGIGLASSQDPKNTLDVDGSVAIGPAYAALATPGSTDVIVEGDIAATTSIVARAGSLSGAERAFFGQSGAGPVGAGSWNPGAGVASGALTGGADGTVLVAGDGVNNVFVARASGLVSARDTLEIDATNQEVRLTSSAGLFIPTGAPTPPAKRLLVSADTVGTAAWRDPQTIAALAGANGTEIPAGAPSLAITGSYQGWISRDASGVYTEHGCAYAWGTASCSVAVCGVISGCCTAGAPGTVFFAEDSSPPPSCPPAAWNGGSPACHVNWTICAQ